MDDRNDKRQPDRSEPTAGHDPRATRNPGLRRRNIALLAALLAFVVIIYIVAVVRMGGA